MRLEARVDSRALTARTGGGDTPAGVLDGRDDERNRESHPGGAAGEPGQEVL
jgi:hypothetical protein